MGKHHGSKLAVTLITLLGCLTANSGQACMDWMEPSPSAPPEEAQLPIYPDAPEPFESVGVMNAQGEVNAEGEVSTQNFLTPEFILQVGRTVWPIIQAGRPVVNMQTDWVGAYPEGVKNWEELQGWQPPVSKNFTFRWRTMGKEVIRFGYQVVLTPGGSLQGRGKYIANAGVIPNQLSVFWGYKFSADIQVSKVLNAGTPEDPVAAMQLVLKCTIDTPLTHHQSSSNFYLTGNGELEPVRR